MNTDNQFIPEYISIAKMAKLLHFSRSRFYQLLEAGFFEKPVYLLSNKRPVYTKEIAMRNIEAKRNNVGINGEIVMFYSPRKIVHSVNKIKTSTPETKRPTSQNEYKELIEELSSLGLEDISVVQVESAISKCFPKGTEKVNQDEILTTVFRHIKRQDTEHKQRA